MVLALLAYSVFQLFGPTAASAVDSKGWWVTPRSGFPANGAYADFNEDCVINILDEQAISFRYGASLGLLLYDQRYDLQPQGFTYNYPPPKDAYGNEMGDDWDIDIKDLQFAFGRDGRTCLMYWDPDVSMGEYSYDDDTPTGSGTSCTPTAQNPPGSNYYKDPIGIVFFADATASRLEQEAQDHGFPDIEHDPEQRFWEVGRCTFEDVDATYKIPGTGGPDPYEQWHFRAEVGAEKDAGGWGGHVNWGTFAVATPHFDDDINNLGCGHYVPQVFPYPEELYPGFEGSGFKAGTFWTQRQFVLYGGHGYADREYWGNIAAIQQECKKDEWPRGYGYVYYIEIF
jgi:hypothetical protein